jgi:hypothetical protein
MCAAAPRAKPRGGYMSSESRCISSESRCGTRRAGLCIEMRTRYCHFPKMELDCIVTPAGSHHPKYEIPTSINDPRGVKYSGVS